MLRGLTFAAIGCAALFVATPFLQAQGGTLGQTPPIVGGAPLIEAWVDPINGSNALAGVGLPDQPFSTLNAAIAAVAALATPATPGLVHANPGVYSLATNGELLPVTMVDNVNVQGTDAKSCVIRGDGVPDGLNPFFPSLVGGACLCGGRVPGEILVDLTFLTNPAYEEKFDSFTMQGGAVQVYAETEVAQIDGTVSNCLFDMINNHDAGVAGPSFGVLMVHTWNLTAGGVYLDVQMNVLNNTFIQTMIVGSTVPPTVFTAIPSNVAIADTNNPLCGNPFGDPNTVLRGVGNPNVQNNLIRHNTILGAAQQATIGLDLTDTSLAGGVPTNAFDPLRAGATDPTVTFCSIPLAGAPIPAINPNPGTAGGADPVFVGEFLSTVAGSPLTQSRDWRILSGSPMTGLGVSPAFAVGAALTAANGTAYVNGATLPEWSFTFDGEGYGNMRTQGAMEIGFDEIDVYIASGFGNDGRNVGVPFFPGDTTPAGFGVVFQLFAAPGTVTTARVTTPTSLATGFTGPFVNPGGFFWAYSCQFGCLVPPAIQGIPGAPFFSDLLWVNLFGLPPLFTVTTPILATFVPGAAYVPLASPGAAPVFFNISIAPAPPVGSYANDQVYFSGVGVPHNPATGGLLSNAQSYRN